MRKGELGLTNRHRDLLLLDWCDTYTERVKSRVRSERYPLMVESVKRQGCEIIEIENHL